MRDTYGNTNAELVALTDRAAGLRYDSPDAIAILDEADWANHWPVVDADGLLTGDVVETDDCENYWNVDDMAMISDNDIRPEQRPSSNHWPYATLTAARQR